MAVWILFFFLLSGLIVAIAAARPIGDTTLLRIGEAAAPSFEIIPVGTPKNSDRPIGDTTLLSISEAAAPSFEIIPVGTPKNSDQPIGDTTLLSISEAAAPSFEIVPLGTQESRDQPIGDTTLLIIGETAAPSFSTVPVGAPESRDQHGTKGHRSSAKSAIGGEAILGGLILAILVTISAYIRVTRKSNLGYKSDNGG